MLQKITHYSPLPDCLTISTSKLHGLGLFAAKQIPAAYDLGITHIEDARFPDESVRTPLGGFINHSLEPNCDLVEQGDLFRLITLRKINKGEELTVDYTPWYDKAALAAFK